MSSSIVDSRVFERGEGKGLGWGGGGGGEGRGEQAAGKSFGNLQFVCQSVLSLCFLEQLMSSLFVNYRLSSGPPGGHPCAHLKASMLCEAPIPAPMMKTPVPTTANPPSIRAEATWRAPTLKTMAKRVDWAAPEAPHQHREATSHPSSQVGAWADHCLQTQRCDPRPRQWDSRIAQVRRVHSVKKHKLRRDSNSCLLPWDTNTTWRACHTPVDHVSSGGACCPPDDSVTTPILLSFYRHVRLFLLPSPWLTLSKTLFLKKLIDCTVQEVAVTQFRNKQSVKVAMWLNPTGRNMSGAVQNCWLPNTSQSMFSKMLPQLLQMVTSNCETFRFRNETFN